MLAVDADVGTGLRLLHELFHVLGGHVGGGQRPQAVIFGGVFGIINTVHEPEDLIKHHVCKAHALAGIEIHGLPVLFGIVIDGYAVASAVITATVVAGTRFARIGEIGSHGEFGKEHVQPLRHVNVIGVKL